MYSSADWIDLRNPSIYRVWILNFNSRFFDALYFSQLTYMKILAQHVINSSKRSVCCNFFFFSLRSNCDEASTFDIRIWIYFLPRKNISVKIFIYMSRIAQCSFHSFVALSLINWVNTQLRHHVKFLKGIENKCNTRRLEFRSDIRKFDLQILKTSKQVWSILP